jgi:hypothetical protein
MLVQVLLMRAIIGQNAEGGKKMITAGATFHHKRLRFKFARITDTSLEVCGCVVFGPPQTATSSGAYLAAHRM